MKSKRKIEETIKLLEQEVDYFCKKKKPALALKYKYWIDALKWVLKEEEVD